MDTLVSKPPNGPAQRKPAKESKASHKALIGRHLQLVFEETAREPLPQRLIDLLSQIEEKEGKS